MASDWTLGHRLRFFNPLEESLTSHLWVMGPGQDCWWNMTVTEKEGCLLSVIRASLWGPPHPPCVAQMVVAA